MAVVEEGREEERRDVVAVVAAAAVARVVLPPPPPVGSEKGQGTARPRPSAGETTAENRKIVLRLSQILLNKNITWFSDICPACNAVRAACTLATAPGDDFSSSPSNPGSRSIPPGAEAGLGLRRRCCCCSFRSCCLRCCCSCRSLLCRCCFCWLSSDTRFNNLSFSADNAPGGGGGGCGCGGLPGDRSPNGGGMGEDLGKENASCRREEEAEERGGGRRGGLVDEEEEGGGEEGRCLLVLGWSSSSSPGAVAALSSASSAAFAFSPSFPESGKAERKGKTEIFHLLFCVSVSASALCHSISACFQPPLSLSRDMIL